MILWFYDVRFWFSLFSSLGLLLPACSLRLPFVLPWWQALTDSTREGTGSQGWFPPVCMGSYLDFCGKSIFSLCSEQRVKTRELVYPPVPERGDLFRERKVLPLGVCPLQPPVPATEQAADRDGRTGVSPARRTIWSRRSKFLLLHRLG